MWNLHSNDLARLKGGGGERFAQFVDRLIRAAAAQGGLAQSEVETQCRVNVPDGGVDTRVIQEIRSDATGFLSAPTCWQFKASDARDVNDRKYKKKRNHLQEEIHKPFASELIEAGYAYRFCVLGDLTSKKAQDWEAQLRAEVDLINAGAPDPRVVHGSDLLPWAERYPAIVAWLRDLVHGVFHWDAWCSNARTVTPRYVPNPEWEPFHELILQHCQLQEPPVGNDPCLTIGGAAGVGKTRLVLEALAEFEASAGMVVYAADEQEAKSVATAIVNTPDQSAILVADECTPTTRHFLNGNLRGHVQRIRVVCMDNTGERLAAMPSQIWLSAESLKNTGAILEANFAARVPADRRRQYASVSGGFVRLAADMCQHDAEIAAGDMSNVLQSIERYIKFRLRNEDLTLVSLLGLFHKVGFRDEKREELGFLCELARCERQQFHDAVRVVKESPGFIVQSGRYWYVTPEIVAHVLFAEGWARWIGGDPGAFLHKLPSDLQQQLIDRAGKLGNEEVRDQLASFFRQWFHRLRAQDFIDARTAGLACAVVEAAPESFLSVLRSILEDAPAEVLSQIAGHAADAKWGPRRTLVWLLENLVSFPSFFRDCEACLFRLALHETEPQIGNNATSIWQDLFSVYLSGTATPFDESIGILRERTGSDYVDQAKLGFKGIVRALEPATGKVVLPPVVAGRMRPPHWEPASAEEEKACYRQVLDLCQEHLASGKQPHRELAIEVLIQQVPYLLDCGLIDVITRLLTPQRLTDGESRALLNTVDRFLESRCPVESRESNGDAGAYLSRVRKWIEVFEPADFDGRLRSVCSREPWDRRFSDDLANRRDETDELAEQIVEEPSRLEPHLQWLATPEAQAAERLGFALGRRDERFQCASMIFRQAAVHDAPGLLRGYVRGLVFAQRQPMEDQREMMSQLEATHPEMAIDILSYGGDAFDGFARAIRLVESGAVSPTRLAVFAMGIGRRELRPGEVGRLLGCFLNGFHASDTEPGRAGLRFLSTIFRFEERRPNGEACLESESVRVAAWELAEQTMPAVNEHVCHDWFDIIRRLSAFDIGRGASLFGRALLSANSSVARRAQKELAQMAHEHPQLVMDAFGAALLDQENGWRMQVGVSRDLVVQLPPPRVVQWARSHGVDAARAIVRHLPPPFVDEAGNPIVPEVLASIFDEFDDDEVFDNFLAGAHSGEMWWGDASGRFRDEAERARQFLTHSNMRIREWAKQEIHDRQRMADWQQQKQAERYLPS